MCAVATGYFLQAQASGRRGTFQEQIKHISRRSNAQHQRWTQWFCTLCTVNLTTTTETAGQYRAFKVKKAGYSWGKNFTPPSLFLVFILNPARSAQGCRSSVRLAELCAWDPLFLQWADCYRHSTVSLLTVFMSSSMLSSILLHMTMQNDC